MATLVKYFFLINLAVGAAIYGMDGGSIVNKNDYLSALPIDLKQQILSQFASGSILEKKELSVENSDHLCHITCFLKSCANFTQVCKSWHKSIKATVASKIKDINEKKRYEEIEPVIPLFYELAIAEPNCINENRRLMVFNQRINRARALLLLGADPNSKKIHSFAGGRKKGEISPLFYFSVLVPHTNIIKLFLLFGGNSDDLDNYLADYDKHYCMNSRADKRGYYRAKSPHAYWQDRYNNELRNLFLMHSLQQKR